MYLQEEKLIMFVKIDNIYTRVKNTYTICTNDQNIVNDWQQYM
jgi:dTDP-4-dehydrorhamnose 3,5-epimerase-like enzyme